jgi:predicted RecB family endonuclease
MQELGARSGENRPGTVGHPAASVVLVMLCIATTACDTQYSGAIAEFGTAATSVLQQTRSAYALVNDTVLQEEILALTTQAGPIASDPKKAFPLFVTEEDLSIRYTMLNALQSYAAALGKLTSKTNADLDTETTTLAASLDTLAKNDRLQHSFRQVKGISPKNIDAGAAGLDAIAKFLINKKIAAQLPAILARNEPHIDAIVTLLIHEIGEPPASDDPGGLRGKLGRTYNNLIEKQTDLVNASQAGSNEKQEDVTKLAALVSAQRNADAALAGTQTALKKLVAAHRALLQVHTAPATFKTEVASLWAEAKDAQEFYARLASKENR